VDNLQASTHLNLNGCSDLLVISRKSPQRDSLELVLSTLRDNPTFRIGMLDYVESLPEALTHVEQKIPALIIMDTWAHQDDILKQVNQIRHKLPSVKLLVLADISLWQALKKATGLDGLLLKGFSSAQLIDLVGKLLNAENNPRLNESGGKPAFADLVQPSDGGAPWTG